MYGNPLTAKQAKAHKNHDGRYVDHLSMSQIHNVPEVATATIAGCGCGFYGWIDNEGIPAWDKRESLFMVYWCVPCQRFGVRNGCQFCNGRTQKVGLYEDHSRKEDR
jgi:hypothetical protein